MKRKDSTQHNNTDSLTSAPWRSIPVGPKNM